MNFEKLLSSFEASIKKMNSNKATNEGSEIKHVQQVKQDQQVNRVNFNLNQVVKPILKEVEHKKEFNINDVLIIDRKDYRQAETIKEELIIDSKVKTATSEEEVNNDITIIENTDNNISVELNEELQGIEIKFKSKPDQDIINKLKEYKFRWHRFKMLWYAKQSDQRLEFAKSLLIDTQITSKQEESKEIETIEDYFTIENKVELTNNNDTITPLQNIDIEHENIFVNALVPSINKNDSVSLNNECIDQDSTLTKFKLVNMIILSNEDYIQFSNNLLNDYEFLKSKGGSEGEYRNGEYQFLYCYGVAIMSEGKETLIIDPSGYSYARYCCRLVDEK